MREQLGETAVRAAAAVGYYSAGTIEFLMDVDRRFYFLEMNTRLQVEHPVTELVTGIDLVKQQLRIAQGEKLDISQADVRINGHAIECRIYAEDPTANFSPSPGLIRYLTLPEGPGIRNDNGVLAGYTVPIHYDPMLSKLITHGTDREEARRRMRRALSEYRVDGIRTTISFYLSVMDDPAFRAGEFDTGFIDRMLPGLDLDSTEDVDVEAAIAAAAIFMLEDSEKVRIPDNGESAWGRLAKLESVGRGDS
jgi:acetyl-CoA carboxylase biotin carboxylase subunit